MKVKYQTTLLFERKIKKVLSIFMVFIGIIWLLPVFFGLMNSFKDMLGVLSDPMRLPTEFYVENFKTIWKQLEYPRLFFNSVVVLFISEFFVVLLSAMAGFWLQRNFKVKGVKVLRNYFMLSMFIPFQAIMVSMVSLFTQMNLTSSFIGLIISNIGLSSPIALFLYFGYSSQIPLELDESAAMDGASTFRTFFQVIFPLMKTMTATVIILTALSLWNEYLRALLLVQNNDFLTLPVGTANVIYGQYLARQNLAVTALIMAALPMIVLFFALQRHIVSGVVAGAVKG